jgi:hypothetical protein
MKAVMQGMKNHTNRVFAAVLIVTLVAIVSANIATIFFS